MCVWLCVHSCEHVCARVCMHWRERVCVRVCALVRARTSFAGTQSPALESRLGT